MLWETGSRGGHGGELTAGVDSGVVTRADVTDLGAVLTGAAEGRSGAGNITLVDSTGLALQDLAIAIAAYGGRGELDLPAIDL